MLGYAARYPSRCLLTGVLRAVVYMTTNLRIVACYTHT